MSRYIDSEAIMEIARDGYHSDFGRSMADLTSLEELIEDTPTADVKEVKHGQWSWYTISKDYYIDIKYECSQCHYTEQYATDFCPNCGAQMDKEVVKE